MKLSSATTYLSRGISPAYDTEGVVVLNQKCIRDNRVNLTLSRTTNPDKKRISEDKYLQQYDVVVNSTGVGTLGRVAQIKQLYQSMTVDSHVTIVRPDLDRYDALYFGYAMFFAQSQIERMGDGATGQTELSRTRLGDEIDIHEFPKDTQKKIGVILGAYDDLIENNSKRIEKLEAMAHLLYRHYFDVSDATDWEKVKIGDILGKAPTSAKLQKSEYLEEGTYPVIDQGKEYIAGYTNKQEAVIADNLPLTVFGDHTRAVKLAHDPFARGADGTQIVVSDILPPYYLYQTIKDLPLSNEHYARHFKLLKATEIAQPPENILSEFEEKVEPIFKLINMLTKRNRNLAKARDLLLPRLMSGEIKV